MSSTEHGCAGCGHYRVCHYVRSYSATGVEARRLLCGDGLPCWIPTPGAEPRSLMCGDDPLGRCEEQPRKSRAAKLGKRQATGAEPSGERCGTCAEAPELVGPDGFDCGSASTRTFWDVDADACEYYRSSAESAPDADGENRCIPLCSNCGHGATSHEVDDEERRECTEPGCTCEQFEAALDADGERCQRCGERYESCYWLTDRLWHKISGKSDGSGLLCIPCAEILARSAGITIWWRGSAREFVRGEFAESAPVCGVCGGGGCGESYNRRLEMRDATESDRIKAELGDVKKILDAHGDDYILVVQHSTADGIKEITYSHQGDPPDTDKTSNGDELQKIRQELSEIRKELETEKQERGEECQKLHSRIAAHVVHLRPHNDDALQKVRQEVFELRNRRR